MSPAASPPRALPGAPRPAAPARRGAPARGTGAATAAALALAVALTAAGCSGRNAVQAGGDGLNHVAGSGTGGLLAHRRSGPVLAGTDLAGQPVSTAGWRGSVVVVNFWASWCAECRSEAAVLQDAYATRHGAVRFLGVVVRDSPTNARSFVADHAMTYPSVVDPDGTLQASVRAANAVPTTVVLDRSGRIAARYSGPVTSPTLFGALLDRLVAESA